MKQRFSAMPVSIRLVLLAALLLLGGWGIVTSLERTVDSLGNYRQSRDLEEWSRIAADLLTAAQHLAYERGRSAVILLAAEPIEQKNRDFIDRRRELADSALDAALSKLKNLSGSDYQKVSQGWHGLQKLRRLVDRDASLPRSGRDATLAQRWFDSASSLIRTIQRASDGLMGHFPPADKTVRLVQLASAALELRITAGIEASYIAQARSAGHLPSRARMLLIYKLRGRGDRLWEEIRRLGDYSGAAVLQGKIDAVSRHHLGVFRPLQEQVLEELAAKDTELSVPLEQLTAASLPTLDGVSELMRMSNEHAMGMAEAQKVDARWHLISHLLWFLGFLLLLAFTVYYLLSRVVRPLEQVDDELRLIGAQLPPARRGNEIDRLRASAEALALSLQARDEAEQRLKTANESLEQRVRESVAELQASEQKYRALIEGANDAVFLHEVDDAGMPGPFLEVNELACTQLGYTREELLRMSPMELDDPAFKDQIPEIMEQLAKQGHAVFETAQMAKNGRSVPVEVSTRLLVLNGRRILFSLVRDITERKWAETALQKLNRELRAISKCNQALVRAQDEQTLLDEICQTVCEDIGYRLCWVGYREHDPEKSLRPVAWAGVDQGYIAEARLSWSESNPRGQGPAGIAVRSGKPFYVQDLAHDGEMAPWREAALQRGYRSGVALPLKDEAGVVFGVFMIYAGGVNAISWEEIRLLEELADDLAYGIVSLRNRAERRLAQEALRNERSLFMAGPTVVFKWRPEAGWPVDYVSANLREQFGYPPERLMSGELPYVDIIHPEDLPRVADEVGSFSQQGVNSFTQTYRIAHADGGYRWVDDYTNVIRDEQENILFYHGYIIDITEHVEAEREQTRLNRFLRTLGSCNEILVHAKEERELLQSMCRVVVEVGGFALAWIGYRDESDRLSVEASEGTVAEIYPDGVDTIDLGDPRQACRPAARALRSGEIQVVQDSAADACAAWRDWAQTVGYASAISLPLFADGSPLGSLNICALEAGGFGEQEVVLLSELAGDLSYGIHALRARVERERFAARLQGSMESTIQALASTVELRDPNTAGHQRRVAKLAVAVARAMGFSEERVQIVYLAALVHDIGKVAVPAEILSKPGKLSDSEMLLVREHARAGYEALRGADFPWPIADIVWQHHERLDGSGYPRGLHGDQITREAQLIGVCDLIEAMLTHRPYRPAFSLDATLAELQSGRGTRFDAEIVDQCLRLFHEEGFRLN